MNSKETLTRPISGFMGLLLLAILLGLTIYAATGLLSINPILGVVVAIISGLCFLIAMAGFLVLDPNESSVLTLFGDYVGSVRDNGFFWTNPFYTKKRISLRARNLETKPIKVNDKLGNPILISAVVVWRVLDTYKSAFEVDHYERFVEIQTESALRKLAGSFSYDSFDDHDRETSLRSGGEEVNHLLEHEMQERLGIAGIQIVEARISNLAYAPEIAHAMLQRQQATAVIAARKRIVEGAVSMVEMALHELGTKEIVHLDEDKKATMVSNLLVVLCSDNAAQPVVNAGSIY
ncbi:MAG: SPFH domain-containing protein [Sphingobacteriales bacterium]|jgi:regulator of protease activity HflC (stomatin/prohibitin superfamily)|nr:SPFH domain-containing protein [Sphingobacteriales bacterium]MBP9142054.1 SPFH domain-containing protein [Chitinophagales bacterium]MDA0198172.1 SPFH domain-containing protein [Bacteroidota bacterium]MBK6889612.1 SPFH domain-containing protein [Sphingobacteriales bacterium]MBK7527877.1 SPFH domain-containing protein [Sphingobacteriales bacterium]